MYIKDTFPNSLMLQFIADNRQLYKWDSYLGHNFVPSVHPNGRGARFSSVVEHLLIVWWVIKLIPFDALTELHDWCNKGRGMCYHICGMVHIKECMLLMWKTSSCSGGSGLPLSLNGPIPYAWCNITKYIMSSAS